MHKEKIKKYKLYYDTNTKEYFVCSNEMLERFIFNELENCKNISDVSVKCLEFVTYNYEDYDSSNLHLLDECKLLFDVIYDILRQNTHKSIVYNFCNNYHKELLFNVKG